VSSEVQVIHEQVFKVPGHTYACERVQALLGYDREDPEIAYETGIEMLKVQAERRGYGAISYLMVDFDIDRQTFSATAMCWAPAVTKPAEQAA
jgi:hypothetical protein